MSTERALPKSLHTITVLELVARSCIADVDTDTAELIGVEQLQKSAMKAALKILKLDTLPDSHGLIPAAMAKIQKGKA